MKSFLHSLVLVGLVVLVACSGDSPSPPAVPTVVPDVWAISSLTATDSNPYVNTAIAVTATVTKDGAPAPDGTVVEFTTSGDGAVFVKDTSQEASVITEGGTATVLFGATQAGSFLIRAQVKTASRQIQVVVREHNTSDALQIYTINPNEGSYAGGETVVLTGKGIQAPVEVYFSVQGTEYQAIVDDVVPSVPLSGVGTITIRTPQPTAANTSTTSSSNVRVVISVGTTEEQQQTLPSAFTFISDSVIVGKPVIFGIEPYYGKSRGGETVTILGLNFAVDVTKELVKNFEDVYFEFRGQRLPAQVERWSATQIEVITPRFSLTPLTADENADLILTLTDSSEIRKDDVFIVIKDLAQPEITGISPTAGPLDGGTVVTITGHGFQVPVQVRFGSLEASSVQLLDDQTVNDNDIITCVTPDYSQQAVTPPFATSVTVTNLATGNSTTSSQQFTFGDTLYVGQANPTQGQIGDLLVLYGAGFEDPLTVWFRPGGSSIEFDVISVTGTEITLRSPPELAPTCDDRGGDFRVVLTDGNREATGGTYTLLGSNPTITAVDPVFVYEFAGGNGVDPSEIDIYGVRFGDNLLVRIGQYTMDPSNITVVTSELIHVAGIPAPNTFNLTFDTIPCTTSGGLAGIKNAPTAVDVTVRNLPVGCTNTLSQALVYVPEDQTCTAAPQIAVTVPPFPATQFPGPSPPQTITVSNNGGGDLVVTALYLGGSFYFDAGCSNQAAPGFTLPPFTPSYLGPDIYFCPGADLGQTYPGQLQVLSNDSGSPETVLLSGEEAHPVLEVSANTLTFPAAGVQSFTVSNTGSGALTFSITETDPDGIFTVSALGGGIPAGGASIQIDVTNSGTGQDGSLEVVAGEADALGSPQTVVLEVTY